jgi:hypothetical protein
MHYYRLPAERPLRVSVSPALSIGLLTDDGRVVREAPQGAGELLVAASDPSAMVLAVLIPSRAEAGGGTLALRIRARHVAQRQSNDWGLPPPGAPGFTPTPGPGPQGVLAPTPTREQIVGAMQSVAPQVQACAGGTRALVDVRATIAGPTGRLERAEVSGAVPEPVRECITRALMTVQVPPFTQPSYVVTYPFRL